VDAPSGPRRKLGARLLLLLAVGFVATGSGLVYGGSRPIEHGSAVITGAQATESEAPIATAEPCYLVWGISDELQRSSRPQQPDRLNWEARGHPMSADLLPDFHPATREAQMDLAAMCEQLSASDSPVHSADKARRPPCTMESVRSYVTMRSRVQWPVNESDFVEALVPALNFNWGARTAIGFHDSALGQTTPVRNDQVAWLLVRTHSKFSTANGEMLGTPGAMRDYMATWKRWFDALPQRVGAQSSVLSKGFVTCRSWELFPTIQAFLDGVIRSLLFTPLVCLGAVFAIVRDVAICYAALLSVAGMIVVTMGLLHLFGMPLGPIESLALAVVIGVSVDYLIHLAYAYKNSLMEERYYKSRAAVLARSNSIASAALTTLCSVLPLLGSRLLPLRQFGSIFTIVTLVSFMFSYGFFNAFMMTVGPLKTRPRVLNDAPSTAAAARDDADIQAAQLEVADEVAWELEREKEQADQDGLFA